MRGRRRLGVREKKKIRQGGKWEWEKSEEKGEEKRLEKEEPKIRGKTKHREGK